MYRTVPAIAQHIRRPRPLCAAVKKLAGAKVAEVCHPAICYARAMHCPVLTYACATRALCDVRYAPCDVQYQPTSVLCNVDEEAVAVAKELAALLA
eukprot:2853932-Rhodomonas_salina.1